MLELNDLGYCYPEARQPALQGIDLHLQAGQCLGLLGSNGAGKTTLLSLLSGVLQPLSGQIVWQGERRLGLVPQQLAFYAGLKVKENLELFADLYELRGPERRQRLDRCIASTALEDKLERRAERLSGGEQRRLNFAIGLLQPAELYLFDEATVGVDATSRQMLLEAVQQLVAEGKTVIYTSHYLDEVERVADRILLLHEGRVQLDIDKHQLLGDQPGLLLEWPERAPEALLPLLDGLGLNVEHLPNGVRIASLNVVQLLAIIRCIAEQAQAPSLLRFGRPSLEQLYLHLNGGRL
ncbi:ABC transporter ATP-binding protein [Pseudomonas daroniae]|uniref:ABC transporter ATP-binding protein n=1 Tax=Phytopseudomonas daroniae TaxID=2487519 RepID=A0A4Q9QLY1_9GAMM|nr:MULTISPECIES: ABC transporter ATP-binding protein [Pseudomonas]TBU76202.1 ABC transporter ATP-binding protein [Pseudomonas daroniae]TBU80306.1 ABC transporter ATP-binding protein [Pseudomonas daroniae]TBU85264.1 ABC transporter ATP-binding protein [Pseudomonas sp. FRB 228]TBU94111.1 ABC transporter ATP-binding protein [Pseudomonas daroniae]